MNSSYSDYEARRKSFLRISTLKCFLIVHSEWYLCLYIITFCPLNVAVDVTPPLGEIAVCTYQPGLHSVHVSHRHVHTVLPVFLVLAHCSFNCLGSIQVGHRWPEYVLVKWNSDSLVHVFCITPGCQSCLCSNAVSLCRVRTLWWPPGLCLRGTNWHQILAECIFMEGRSQKWWVPELILEQSHLLMHSWWTYCRLPVQRQGWIRGLEADSSPIWQMRHRSPSSSSESSSSSLQQGRRTAFSLISTQNFSLILVSLSWAETEEFNKKSYTIPTNMDSSCSFLFHLTFPNERKSSILPVL